MCMHIFIVTVWVKGHQLISLLSNDLFFSIPLSIMLSVLLYIQERHVDIRRIALSNPYCKRYANALCRLKHRYVGYVCECELCIH